MDLFDEILQARDGTIYGIINLLLLGEDALAMTLLSFLVPMAASQLANMVSGRHDSATVAPLMPVRLRHIHATHNSAALQQAV